MKKTKILFLLVIATLLATGLRIDTAPTTWHVPGDFATISAAVAAASPGDKIELAAGTYQEQVIIPKSLDLYSNEGATIVAPASPTGWKFTEGGSSIWDPIVAAFGGTISGTTVSGSGQIQVNVWGITVDGNSRIPAQTSRRAVGILYRNVIGNITNNTVKKMGYAVGFTNSWCIMVYGSSNSVIGYNKLSGYAKGGVVVNGLVSNPSLPVPYAVVENNIVTGPPYDSTLALAPNGVQIGWGAKGIIRNNTITHNGSPGTDWGGTAVLTQSSKDVIVEGNNVIDNQDYGVAVSGYDSYGTSYAVGTVIKNNTIQRNGQGIRIEKRSIDTTIQGNTITANEEGIHIGSSVPTSLNSPMGVALNQKQLCPTDSTIDLYAVEDLLVAYPIPPTNTEIHNNQIYDNTNFGAFVTENPTQEEVDASNNWWGSCDGPAPYGAGNAVSGNINVLPFLCISKAPIAVITATPEAGIAPLTVTFDGSQSYATESGVVIVDWVWNFGEGLVEYGSNILHTYNAAGEYTALLKVEDSNGKLGSSQKNIRAYNLADLRVEFYSEKPSIKANGKGYTFLFAHIYGPQGIVLENLGLIFSIDNGTLTGLTFNPTTGEYRQQLFSGSPGVGNAQAVLGGTVVGNLQVSYLWVQPPMNLEATYNGGAYVYQYNLKWSINPLNSMFDIVKYNIYRGGELIGSTNGTDFSDAPAQKNVTYGVSAVDSEGDESEIVVAVKQ
ncbi:MAG: right-handed parallel beta-helix repeat-containing protein [Candidatus Nanoarchaeia archaeon]|nr:right-handed parallel beta-helix repeat-containing protein [Candidatus Nanoarchaeia archaeon]